MGRHFASHGPSIGALAAFVLFGAVLPAFAQPADQPPPRTSSPDRLDFGQVRVGAKVEGSVHVMVDGKGAFGVPLQVYPPPFAVVSGAQLFPYDQGNGRLTAAVYLTISTDQLGVAEGDLIVFIGDMQAAVPVRVDIVEPSEDATKVLVTNSPFHRQGGVSSRADRWRELVKEANLDPDYRNSARPLWITPELLEDIDVVLLGGETLLRLTPQEIEHLQDFAREGGRLVVSASSYYVGTVPAANRLIQAAGMKLKEPGRLPRDPELQIVGDDLAEHPLLADVKSIWMDRVSGIEIVDAQQAQSLIGIPTIPGWAYAAIGKIDEGDVVVLGDAFWSTWIDPQIFKESRHAENHNAQFLKNVLTLRDPK